MIVIINNGQEEQIEKSANKLGYVSVAGVQAFNNTLSDQTQYKSIMRKAVLGGAGGSCPEMVYYKGAWVGPGDSIGKRMMDSSTSNKSKSNKFSKPISIGG